VADVRQIDLQTGAESQLIGGLRMAIDVLPIADEGLCQTFYTLEYMSSATTPASGRIQRFNSPGGQPTVIVNNLAMPTGMALHPNGDLLVTGIFAGRITRISNIP